MRDSIETMHAQTCGKIHFRSGVIYHKVIFKARFLHAPPPLILYELFCLKGRRDLKKGMRKFRAIIGVFEI